MAAGDLISSRGGIAGSGVVTGAVITSGAMVFDGVDDVIETNVTLNQLGALSELTVSAWVNSLADGVNQEIVTVYGGVGFRQFVLYKRSTNDFRAIFYNATTNNLLQSGVTGTIGEWFHIATSYKSGEQKIYVNGVAVGNIGVLTGNILDVARTIKIGDDTLGFFNGSINNVLIFNRALTQPEVTAIYNAGKDAYSPVTDGLVAQYSGRDYYGTAGAPKKIYNAIYPPNEPLKTHIDQMNLPTVTDKFICLPRVGRNNSFYAFAVNREA